MRTFLQDLNFGLRVLKKNPVFALVAVITLALGIGVNTSVFSLCNALLFRIPKGIDRPEAIALVGRNQKGSDFNTLSYPDYIDFRDENTSFVELAAYRETDLYLTTHNSPEPMTGMLVTGNYFRTLGTPAERGRMIQPEDDSAPGANSVAVISHALWERRFASDPNIVGKVIDLNNFPFTIVGVAQQGFAGTEISQAIDFWLPLTMYSQADPGFYEKRLELRHIAWLGVLGRIKPGATLQQAQADLMRLSGRLEQIYPDTDKGLGVTVAAGLGLQPQTRAEARTRMALLLAVTGLVLLIVCANVANLFLERAIARRRELTVRRALGASTPRLVRQLLTEASLISIGGGVLGLLVAVWSKALLLRSNVLTGIRLSTEDLRLDALVLAFALAITVVTGLIFGLVPAFDASVMDLQRSLKDRSASGSRRSGFRAMLVTGEIALSVVVLICAGLFVKTLLKTQSVNPGFDADRILAMPIDIGRRSFTEGQGRVFYDELTRRVRGVPGVTTASLAITRPLGGQWRTGIRVDGQSSSDPDIVCDYNIVAPGYFQTLGIPLMSGRDFNVQDRVDSPAVVIVGEEFARREFPHDNPIGKRISNPRYPGDTAGSEIVGVARDVKYEKLTETPRLYFYVPLSQRYQSGAILFARSNTADASGLVKAISYEITGLDRNVPIYGLRTLGERLRASLAPQRSAATLLGVFSLLGIAIASVGLYGVLAYSVAQRQQEIGIRMALGAGRKDILKMVLKQGALLGFGGVIVGLLIALATTHLVASQLYEVSTADPAVYITVVAVMAMTAFVACLIPGLRATKVDPLVALRYE